MSTKIKAIALAIALAGASTSASAAVITFEGFADGTVFTTQNFGSGVTFAGAQILALGGMLNPQFPPKSGINVVYNPSGPMELLFNADVDFFSGFFTYNQALTITAFDVANMVVDTASGACTANFIGAGTGCMENEFVTVSAPGAIRRVVIAGGGGNNFTLDDASFTGAIDPNVPEPASIALLLGGIAAAGAIGRRRAR